MTSSAPWGGGASLAPRASEGAVAGSAAARVSGGSEPTCSAESAGVAEATSFPPSDWGSGSLASGTEATAGDIQTLAEFIAERQIPAIFVESSVPPATIEAVQAAVQDRGFDVAIGGQLFSDAMGAAGTPEGTYLGMVRHNVDTMVGALAGDAAATPAA